MPRAKPISQNVLFYYGEWTRSVESLVLGKLEYKRWEGVWIPGPSSHNMHLLFGVKMEMRDHLHIDISLEDYHMKVQEWEDRYHQFIWLINQPNFVYDTAKNVVNASKETWDSIAELRPEMCVYMKEGEFNYARLTTLFKEIPENSASRIQLPQPTNSGGSVFSEVVDKPNLDGKKTPIKSLSSYSREF
ncbi:uncharacterized protein LOC131011949 [Salvia miltiorrhiza]|uniref:uncharacterized protein LOC131011949 n=1 Tax=Salvia miltiorrhiza TaxID=226208 RepID=UPI0025ACCBCE|nr:uncharacterized protein LOC131011949 [Salvia miltiorrhiza]